MRNWMLVLAVGGLLFLIPNTAIGQTKEFNETVDFTPGSDLLIDADKGSLKLTSWDQDRVEIYARIEAPRDVDREYAEEVVEATKIEVYEDSRGLRIRSDFDDVPYYSDGWGFGRNRRIPDVHYEIRAPRSLNLELDIDGNRATIEGFEGSFRIEADRCDMEARDWVGDIRLDMDRGELKLTEASGSLDIETDRTNVRIDVIDLTGNSRFDADRGRVELSIPESQGFNLRADVGRRGDFDSDFSITTRSLRRDTIEGAINGGGPEVRFHGDRANFRLRRG